MASLPVEKSQEVPAAKSQQAAAAKSQEVPAEKSQVAASQQGGEINEGIFTTMRQILDEKKVCHSHGIDHAMRVYAHAAKALRCHNPALDRSIELAVLLASLLHDMDDRKFFPSNRNYENARALIRFFLYAGQSYVAGKPVEVVKTEIEELAIKMIGLVSCSKNGDTILEEAKEKPWLLWPRYFDRLEAVGWIGVVRCWEYTLTAGRPLYLATTPRARTGAEVLAIATAERAAAYKGDSASMIDHYYDKLLHLVDVFAACKSGNEYIDLHASLRRKPLLAVVMNYGMTGKLDDSDLTMAREAEKIEDFDCNV